MFHRYTPLAAVEASVYVANSLYEVYIKYAILFTLVREPNHLHSSNSDLPFVPKFYTKFGTTIVSVLPLLFGICFFLVLDQLKTLTSSTVL